MIRHGQRRQLRPFLPLSPFSLLPPPVSILLVQSSSYSLSCQHTAWPEVTVIHINMQITITDDRCLVSVTACRCAQRSLA